MWNFYTLILADRGLILADGDLIYAEMHVNITNFIMICAIIGGTLVAVSDLLVVSFAKN